MRLHFSPAEAQHTTEGERAQKRHKACQETDRFDVAVALNTEPCCAQVEHEALNLLNKNTDDPITHAEILNLWSLIPPLEAPSLEALQSQGSGP